jgi:hypothetical protein
MKAGMVGQYCGLRIMTSELMTPGKVMFRQGDETVAIASVTNMAKVKGVPFNTLVFHPDDWSTLELAMRLLQGAANVKFPSVAEGYVAAKNKEQK